MPITGSKTIKEIDESKEKEDLKTLEAVFFISGRFLNMKDLISLSDLNPIILGDLIERLKDKYNKEDSAIEIIEKGGMWKMDVRQEYSHIINKLATGSAEFTKAEQETLAIIAYKHPIKQSVIIKIRGNKAYDHIKKFSDLGLIKRKKIGHTNELSLSEDFYDYFSISESDRTTSSGLNKEIDREIKEAEKEVEEEEAEGKFESELNDDKDEYKKGVLGKEKKPEEMDYREEGDKDEEDKNEKLEEEELPADEESEINGDNSEEEPSDVSEDEKEAINDLRKIADIESKDKIPK